MTTPRDASAIELRCPHCKTGGIAFLTRDPGSAKAEPGETLWQVPVGFRLAREGRNATMTEFRCEYCDEIAG